MYNTDKNNENKKQRKQNAPRSICLYNTNINNERTTIPVVYAQHLAPYEVVRRKLMFWDTTSHLPLIALLYIEAARCLALLASGFSHALRRKGAQQTKKLQILYHCQALAPRSFGSYARILTFFPRSYLHSCRSTIRRAKRKATQVSSTQTNSLVKATDTKHLHAKDGKDNMSSEWQLFSCSN